MKLKTTDGESDTIEKLPLHGVADAGVAAGSREASLSSARPAVRPRQRWALVVMFLGIAILAPVVQASIESGTAALIWSYFFGVKSTLPTLHLVGAQVGIVAWAWAIFFGVVAVIAAADPEKSGSATIELKSADVETLDGNPDSWSSSESEPKVVAKDDLSAESDRKAVESLCTQGSVLHRMGRHEEAISRFDKALGLDPRFASAWFGRGLANSSLGQYEEAIRCYDKALELDPRDSATWYNKGNSLCAVGRYEDAVRSFNEVLVLNPLDATAWNNKGVCLAGLGRYDEALGCYAKALVFEPAYSLAWRARGLVQERLGRIEDAVSDYTQFIAHATEADAKSVEDVRRRISELVGSSKPDNPEPEA